MLYEGMILQGFCAFQLGLLEIGIYCVKVQKEILYTFYPELRIDRSKMETEGGNSSPDTD
jgi:hypothetical protein